MENPERLLEHWPPVTLLVLACAIVMIVVGALAAGGETEGLAFEVARAGVGVLAVAFLGGGAAAAFRQTEEIRADKKRRDEYRAGLVSELWDAYHEIKATRRALNADRVTGKEANRKKLPVYQQQMARLDAAQLTLEKLLRTVRREEDVFKPYRERLLHLLRIAENYAQQVHDDYEKDTYKHLPAFIGSSTQPGGIRQLSVAVERAANLIYALRSESATKLPTDPKFDSDLHGDLKKLPDVKARRAELPPCCR